MKFILPLLYVIGLYGAYMAGFLYLRNKSTAFHFPTATVLLLFAIGVPSTLQFFFPRLLAIFQRDPTQIYQGEWWRLITFLFVQDGGIAGTVFNLISLLLVGAVAEQFWKWQYMALLFFTGGILGGLVAFAWQPIGAGNSVGNFSLSASIAVTVLMSPSQKPIKVPALFAIGVYLTLMALRDIHGAASLAGGVLAFFLLTRFTDSSLLEPRL